MSPALNSVSARDPREGRHRLGFHVAVQEFGDHRVLGGLVNQPIPGQVSEVTQALMAGVEQPQLHRLVRRHVVDELDAGLVQRGPAVGEIVLENPHGERLGDHGPGVAHTEFGVQPGDHLGSGDGRDAVDHRVGERGVFAHPLREFGIEPFGVRRERAPGHVPVFHDVVARHDRGEGRPRSRRRFRPSATNPKAALSGGW